jgi:hypothetical protein
MEYAQKQKKDVTVQEFLKTTFEVKSRGTSWEFVVAEMRFRPKPR